MPPPRHPLFLAGKPHDAPDTLSVTDKHSGATIATVARADAGLLDRAIAAAAAAAPAMRAMRGYQRRDALERLTEACRDRRGELEQTLCAEAGKPIRAARAEVDRLLDTLQISAAWATRAHAGEFLPLDVSERAAGYEAVWKRVPIGPCAFITPWNFPLNLVAHKAGPALASGCPFVLKPASHTPLSALLLGEMLAGCGLPEGAFSILPMRSADADALVTDPRLRKLSFTGSGEVGWALRARAGRKRVTLELGGNAACIVDETLSDADAEDAVQRIVAGAFGQAGQSCISVQRVIVERSIYDGFVERLVAATRDLPAGDPRDEATVVGPMITEDEARRVEAWVAEAAERGGRVLCGGRRDGAVYHATLIENAPRDARVSCEEVFGPVATIEAFDTFDDALARANDTRYGLQAGVFTRDLHRARLAWDTLEVGGVVVNDVPTFRVDHMPYGGVKESGEGREGVPFAIESMTEVRLLVTRERPPAT